VSKCVKAVLNCNRGQITLLNGLIKKKIELWVLCLAGLISLLLANGTGILVRQELLESTKLGINQENKFLFKES